MLTASSVTSSAADAALTIVSESVSHAAATSRREYELSLALYSSPSAPPQHKLAAIAGLCRSRDVGLLQQTLVMLTTGQVAQEDMARFLYVRSFSLSFGSEILLFPCLEREKEMI